VRHLAKITQYAKVTQSGDKSGLADVPEHSPVWMQVTSTRDNCLGQECPQHKECFVLKARKEAMEADIVVVNHHLFFADVMLRDEGVAELLPACNTVIFDEAHQLPETASLFFGESISTSQLMDLARDARLEAATSANDFAALPPPPMRWTRPRATCAWYSKMGEGRMPAHATDDLTGFAAALRGVSEKLTHLNGMLESQAQRSEGLEKCWQRGVELLGRSSSGRETHPLP